MVHFDVHKERRINLKHLTLESSLYAKIYRMKLPKHSWQEVLMYSCGMLTVILGVGSCVISIDPRPFPSSSWWCFLVGGVILVTLGCVLLSLLIKAPVYSKRFFSVGPLADVTTSSAADLLNDTQSVGYGDSPIVELREAKFSIDEPIHVFSQCMMTKFSVVNAENISLYKETFV